MRSIPIPSTGDLIANKYRLDETLGRGGFGIVFKATHLEMSRLVALKTLLPQVAAVREAVDRFRREAVLASQLRHPNTITLFDYGQTHDGILYLVMELLRGKTLRDLLNMGRATDPERARKICVQVLKSLTEAHQLGIVHLDLKPGNIFLCEVPGESDFVKVLDFGVARMFADPRNSELSGSLTFGTPRYMSPEQIVGEAVSPATDIYALGLIGYELLMGQPAYVGRTPLEIVAKQLNQPVPRLPEGLRGTLLGRMVDRATLKLPAERYQKAADALKVLMGEEPPIAVQGRARPVSEDAQTNLTKAIPDDDAGATATHSALGELLGDAEWPSMDGSEIDSAPTTVRTMEEVQRGLMEEARLDLDADGELDDAKTRVHAGFEVRPTEASVLLVSDDELVEVLEGGSARPGKPSEPSAARGPVARPEAARPSSLFPLVSRGAVSPPKPDASARAPLKTAPATPAATARASSEALEEPTHEAPFRPAPLADPPKAASAPLSPSASPRPMAAPTPALEPSRPTAAPAPGASSGSNPALSRGSGPREARPDISSAPRNLGADPNRPPETVGSAPRAGRAVRPPEPQASVRPPAPQAGPAPASGARLDRNLVIALGLLGLGVVAVLTVVLVALLATLMKGEPAAPTVVVQPSQGVAVPAEPKANAPSVAEEAKPPNARLKISSEPSEAKVFADERFAGTTPLELTRDAPKGEVRLVLRLDGYADEPMDVAFDGDREVHVSLRKNEAQTPPEDPPKEQPKAEAKGDGAGEKKEPVAEKAPVAAVEKKPAPVVEKKPATEQKSAPVAEKKPAPVAEKKPAPVVEKKPAPVAEKKPTPAPTEKKPATPEKKTTGKAPVDKW